MSDHSAMRTPPITDDLLDHFERVSGEMERLPSGHGMDPEVWELVEALLLDLHLIRHGYADDRHTRHVEKRLQELCSDQAVAERMRGMRI